MKFKFREKYESAAEFAAEVINKVVETTISTSFVVYDFSKNMCTDDGRKTNWDNIGKKANEFAKIIMEEAKKIWKDVIDNWEAAIILSLATIGLIFIIGELPNFIWIPAFIEAPMVVPVISVLIIMLLVTLLEHKIKEDGHETAGERAG